MNVKILIRHRVTGESLDEIEVEATPVGDGSVFAITPYVGFYGQPTTYSIAITHVPSGRSVGPTVWRRQRPALMRLAEWLLELKTPDEWLEISKNGVGYDESVATKDRITQMWRKFNVETPEEEESV